MQNLKLTTEGTTRNVTESFAQERMFDACRKYAAGSKVELRNGYAVIFGQEVKGICCASLLRDGVSLANATVDVWDTI